MTEQDRLETVTRPSQALIEDIKQVDGPIMILGAGGKVGPSLALKAKRACAAAGISKQIIAVSKFDDPDAPELMRQQGLQVYETDLFDPEQLAALPKAQNIIFMTGRKFGTTQNQDLTWAVNVLLPAKICEAFPEARIVAFSTGNIYGDRPAGSGGASETDSPAPDGEYGQTCLGRERVFSYYAKKNGTKSLMFRLNYAVDLRYGVLYDIAKSVWDETPVKLGRGVFNCIWQGDVCEYALRSLLHTANPPAILNVTGPETISTRWAAEEFGRIFQKTPRFEGEEQPQGIFSNTTRLNEWMGYPSVTLGDMIRWQAEWVQNGAPALTAPTHFDTTDGKY